MADEATSSQMIASLELLWDQPLAKPNRVFVREGRLKKVCRKGDELRHFFLFNDVLLYGQESALTATSRKYRHQHTLNLQDIIVKPSSEREFGIEIRSSYKSFIVFANDAADYDDWLAKLNHHIEVASKEPREASTFLLWVQDDKINLCQLCQNSKFSLINRKHQCRSCGRCVCSACSDKTWRMGNISKSPVRVCRECFDCLTSGVPTRSRISEVEFETKLKKRGVSGSSDITIPTESIMSDSSDDDFDPDENPFFDYFKKTSKASSSTLQKLRSKTTRKLSDSSVTFITSTTSGSPLTGSPTISVTLVAEEEFPSSLSDAQPGSRADSMEDLNLSASTSSSRTASTVSTSNTSGVEEQQQPPKSVVAAPQPSRPRYATTASDQLSAFRARDVGLNRTKTFSMVSTASTASSVVDDWISDMIEQDLVEDDEDDLDQIPPDEANPVVKPARRRIPAASASASDSLVISPIMSDEPDSFVQT